jgi:hypothetical protein
MLIGLIKIIINLGGEMTNLEGIWLSIIDYSQYRNTSISTIRRHIKNNILKYKEENGKYFIYVPSSEKIKIKEDSEVLKFRLELEEIKNELKNLREENNELKMLVALYENQSIKNNLQHDLEIVPELPESP